MNSRHRSLVLGATLCGAWLWTVPAQAQLVGGTLGGGARGSLVGGPGLAVGENFGVDASGSLRSNPGELRETAAEARRGATERTRAARETASAAGQRASDASYSAATAVLATSAATQADVSSSVDTSPMSADSGPARNERKAKDADKSDERQESTSPRARNAPSADANAKAEGVVSN
jgi:hypothetical protein